MSRYNMEMVYRPGKDNQRADALSRREQDVPSGEDERIQKREFQMLKPSCPKDDEEGGVEWIMTIEIDSTAMTNEGIMGHQEEEIHHSILDSPPLQPSPMNAPGIEPRLMSPKEPTLTKPPTTPKRTQKKGTDLERWWKEGKENDEEYRTVKRALEEGATRFPAASKLKISISECSIDKDGEVNFRERKWVPRLEPLRTEIIHQIHTSIFAGHPGKEITYKLVSRRYFWPNMSEDIKKYTRNCDVCGRTKSWRDGLRDFLKPLPLPNQIWQEISIDFIMDFPESNGCTVLVVVTDQLSKDVIIKPLKDATVETTVWMFIENVLALHRPPRAITSDRGPQFISDFWKRFCEILKIDRRLSTAYHPQTDGSTKRMNSTIEAYLRAFVNWNQKNWAKLYSFVQLAVKNREAFLIGMSPFFLQYGYDVDIF